MNGSPRTLASARGERGRGELAGAVAVVWWGAPPPPCYLTAGLARGCAFPCAFLGVPGRLRGVADGAERQSGVRTADGGGWRRTSATSGCLPPRGGSDADQTARPARAHPHGIWRAPEKKGHLIRPILTGDRRSG
jgi:hypothetical protein